MKDVTQLESFAPDALKVRESVIAGPFKTHDGPDGAAYTGISTFQVPHWYDHLALRLGKRITPRLSCFRLNLEGELPHSWVHSDDICATYATVLYLNLTPQCQGGTAFWRHRRFGIDRLPSREELLERGTEPDYYYRSMDKDWKILGLWEQVGFVPMAWNRLITYPTSLFHSRYPFTGFGKAPADGRLIWICFYDLKESKA